MLVRDANGGFVSQTVRDLETRIKRDDPMLFVQVAITVSKKTGKELGHGVEVWRHCDDGLDRKIGGWPVEQIPAIPGELERMRRGYDVIKEIEENNARAEKAIRDAQRDSYGAMMEHLASIVADTTGPKTTFRQVGGLRDTK